MYSTSVLLPPLSTASGTTFIKASSAWMLLNLLFLAETALKQRTAHAIASNTRIITS